MKVFKKPVVAFGTILILGVSWILFKNFEVAGLNNLKLVPRKSSDDSSHNPDAIVDESRVVAKAQRTQQGKREISIATFNLSSFNETKARKPDVVDIYVRIIREFDIVAIQEIQSDTDDLIPRLTNEVNKLGQSYDYVVGDRVGPKGTQEQFAYVFNLKTVEVDRKELYTVDDPQRLLTRAPFVGWFRCRSVPLDEAFTFSLVNVHVDSDHAHDELDVLHDVMFAVRNDGREEDDVIMLGDFSRDYRSMGRLSRLANGAWAVGNIPTMTNGTGSVDNLVFQKTATSEFTGHSGVLDFLREYNLSVDQALEVSDHMPVWATFSVFEDGERGRVARSRGTAKDPK